jgi:hypothetical protein
MVVIVVGSVAELDSFGSPGRAQLCSGVVLSAERLGETASSPARAVCCLRFAANPLCCDDEYVTRDARGYPVL